MDGEAENIDEVHTPALSIVETLPIESGVLERQKMEFRPNTQPTEGAVVEIEVPNNSPYHYIDLEESKISASIKIVNNDETESALEEGVNVGTINLTLQSMFSQWDLMIQGVNTSTVGNYWPYKCYIDFLKEREYGDIKRTSEIYWPDTAGALDVVTLDGESVNVGFKTRAKYFDKSNTVQLYGSLCADFAKNGRYLINNVPIKMRMIPSRPEFVLLASENVKGYKLKILDIVFQAVMVKIDPLVMVAHAEVLRVKPASYYFNDSVISIHTIPKGEYTAIFENLFTTECPSEVIVGMVTSEAFHGKVSLNPFKFSHMNVSSMDLAFNGHSVFPGPFTPDFTANTYLESYHSFFNRSQIQRSDYPGGYSLWEFKLGELHTEDSVGTPLQGHLRLTIRLKEKLPSATSVIIYGKRPAVIKIDMNRSILK